MTYCGFATFFMVDRREKIKAHTRQNRVVTFQPLFSHWTPARCTPTTGAPTSSTTSSRNEWLG